MKYQNFVIEASNSSLTRDADKRWWRTMDVRVSWSDRFGNSPVGWTTARCDERALQEKLHALDARELDREGMFALGRLLSYLLIPAATEQQPGIRELLTRSIDAADAVKEGVRLRLVLPPLVASLPWEYLYLDRTGGSEDTANGFVALDPRIAIVRDEAMPVPAQLKPIVGDISVLAALASPVDRARLDLKNEEKLLRDALTARKGVRLEVLADATLEEVNEKLAGAQIFHFAGHGALVERPGEKPGEIVGEGMLAFDEGTVSAEQLGVNLRGNHIQLAVLGGCETGRRIGKYTLGSVAVGLVRSEIPAVVANQFTIFDRSALIFARAFYAALAGGLPLERAVHAGRLAIFNGDQANRDWGVPVLYLRAPDGQLFSGVADPKAREAARDEAEVHVVQRLRDVAKGGFATGAKVREVISGKLDVEMTIDGTVYGKAVGAQIGHIGGGKVTVTQNIDTVGEGGEAVGLDLDSLGGGPFKSARPDPYHRAPPKMAGPASAPAAMPAPVPMPESAPPVAPPTAPGSSSTVNVGRMDGGTAIGTQYNYSTFTQVTAAGPDPDTGLIKEELRLDVGSPNAATVGEPFDLVVQIKQPGSPPLSVADGEQVNSADGSVFRRKASEIVHYKIVPSGDGFEFSPPSLRLQLLPNNESRPVSFEVISRKSGKRKLRVIAYQDDDTFAAQTFLSLDIAIATQN